MATREKQITEILKEHGLRPSAPRVAIYGYLSKKCTHPGAETIYQKLLPALPGLSLTTVYNTLKLFQSHGLIAPVYIDHDEVRYDTRISFHAHFKCRNCGEIIDLFADEVLPQLPQPEVGFQVENTVLDFFGLCPHCAAQK